jgi:hypothetical protein
VENIRVAVTRIVAALDRAPVAIASRAGGTGGPVARRAASRVFNLVIRSALGLPFGDTQSGLLLLLLLLLGCGGLTRRPSEAKIIKVT